MKVERTGLEIAIIGMAGRFPGARDIDSFWRNLRDGVNNVTYFTDEEVSSVMSDNGVLEGKQLVKAKGVLPDFDRFDAEFFGYRPKEAEIMDPQMRQFHEVTWEVLENAGYNPDNYNGLIGLYAGALFNPFTSSLLMSKSSDFIEMWALMQYANKDYLSTQISYKLNLKGPSLVVETACSTSLVAIDLACQALLSAKCDIGLAGGVSVTLHDRAGYLYQEGMIHSPDGYCRAFDANANGTVIGNGAGLIAMKLLDRALEDGDTIHAIIKGSAVNNDGSRKVGFTAPSIEGQAEVIRAAHRMAEVEPDTISYIEAHGTGTNLGDPVEVQALKIAFNSELKQFCALGSVKTNIGHLDEAAGVAGVIKTVLAMKHGQIPPSLHFENPNPKLEIHDSPFYVNPRLRPWENGEYPRRAGVSSFGIGGTNAHIVLEQAPELEETSPGRPWQLLLLSGRSLRVLSQSSKNLKNFLDVNQDTNMADVAYTLQIGRKAFSHRKAIVCQSVQDALAKMNEPDPGVTVEGIVVDDVKRPAFMFPGQGAQYAEMGQGLYLSEEGFRREFDRGQSALKSMGYDFNFYPANGNSGKLVDAKSVNETAVAQVFIFLVEYALAKLLMSWDFEPHAMIGHSLGEYTAACLAGVFSFEDGLRIVAERGRLMQEMPRGAMLSVMATEDKIRPLLGDVELAAVNGPSHCVVTGADKAVGDFQDKVSKLGWQSVRLQTSHAYHSRLMEPMLEVFEKVLSQTNFQPPSRPFISNLTGAWISVEQAMSPKYWLQHLRNPVMFAKGLRQMVEQEGLVLIEVGPGNTLSTLARKIAVESTAVNVMRHVREEATDDFYLSKRLAELWAHGVEMDWHGYYAHERRRRLPLMTYPFERTRYRLDVNPFSLFNGPGSEKSQEIPVEKKTYFHIPAWEKSPLSTSAESIEKGDWLIFMDEQGIGADLADKLKALGHQVFTARAASIKKQRGTSFAIRPGKVDDYAAAVAGFLKEPKKPKRIVHLLSLDAVDSLAKKEIDKSLKLCFFSIIDLVKALGKKKIQRLDLQIVTSGLYAVDAETCNPAQSTILGLTRHIPLEYPNIKVSVIDLDDTEVIGGANDLLLQELERETIAAEVAYRNDDRFLPQYDEIFEDNIETRADLFKHGGVYLITGGLGGIGMEIAQTLARRFHTRLILTGRSSLPAKAEWESISKKRRHEHADAVNKLLAIERAGGELLVCQGSVSSRNDMTRIIASAKDRFGTIDGVIHCAGVPGGELIQGLSRKKSEEIFAPKIFGSLLLNELLTDEPLDFFILCSSLTAIHGAVGQASYASANSFMDALAQRLTYDTGRTVLSINWDAWREVGMAVRSVRGLSAYARQQPIEHPFLTSFVDAGDSRLYSGRLSTTSWVLDEHRIVGQSAFPGTGYLELARAAMSHFGGTERVELRDVYFLTPLTVEKETPIDIFLQLEKSGEFVIYTSDDDCERIEHCKGKAFPLAKDTATAKFNLKKTSARCDGERLTTSQQIDEYLATETQGLVGRWSCLTQVQFGDKEALGLLALDQRFEQDIDDLPLHPALLDIATGFYHQERGYLPFSYRRIRIYEPLKPRLLSQAVRVREVKQDALEYEINVADSAGRLLVAIEGYTFRYVHQQDVASPPEAPDRPKSENVALVSSSYGNLESLHYAPRERKAPQATEVEIEVYATGLNFKEVLIALGMVPPPTEGFKFGLECSGKVVTCGEEVKDFKVGDEVIALANGSFAKYVRVAADFVAPKPVNLTFAQATTIPIAYMTAYYSLIEKGLLKSGERILIHAASGGVGLAAVQIAKWVGAEIFATAGNPDKRKFLSSLGIKYVMDSRSLDFADQVMEYTNGEGVDVLLNSLAGDYLKKGLSIMAINGRFLEIGIRDIIENTNVGLAPFERGLSFIAINEIKAQDGMSKMFRDIIDQINKGDFTFIPLEVFRKNETAHAFKHMAQTKHIGKVIVVQKESALLAGEGNGTRVNGKMALDEGLFTRQGINAMEKALAFSKASDERISQVVISSKDWFSGEESSALGLGSIFKSISRHEDATSKRVRPQLKSTYHAPANQLQKAIAKVIQEHLGYQKIGIEDNFFELGLSSLDMIQMNEKLKSDIGCDIPVVTLFTYPTISSLTKHLSEADGIDEKETAEARSEKVQRGRASRQRRLELRKGAKNG